MGLTCADGFDKGIFGALFALATVSFVFLASGTEVICRLNAIFGGFVQIVSFIANVTGELLGFLIGCGIFLATIHLLKTFQVIIGEGVSINTFDTLIQEVCIFFTKCNGF
jgi:hypothetical protein